MSNIEVGEYCRTKQGYIAKLEDKSNDFLYFDSTIYNYYEESPVLPIKEKLLDGTYLKAEDYITTHSKNIIDLIEVGDIVKVEGIDEVREVLKDNFYNSECFDNDVRAIIDEYNYSKQIKECKILQVVTKEQFKKMEYRIDE